MLPKQDPITSMQHVLVDLQYEKAYIFSNLIKYNFCNFTLLMPGAVTPFAPLCAPLVGRSIALSKITLKEEIFA